MRSFLWLALGSFAVGTEGMMIAGLLPRIGADLGISVAEAGDLVTVFGLAYAVGSPLIAVATGAIERKRLLLFAMAGFALANLLAAWSPGFVGLLASRALLALAAGTFMPAASAYAAATATPERRGQALSLVYTGFTLSLVIGVPLGTLVGTRLGWRSTFEGVAVLAALAWIGIALALGRLPGSAPVGLRARFAAARMPGVGPILLLTILAIAGAFSVFTYFAPLLRRELAVGDDGVAFYLLLFGAAAFVGNLAGGYLADHVPPRRALLVAASVMMVTFITLTFAGHLHPRAAAPIVGAAVVVWGLFGWAFLPLQQARLASAVPTLVPVALSLNASCIYVGTALGAGLAGIVVAQGSVVDVGWVAAGWAGLGIVLLLVTGRRPQRGEAALRGSLAAEIQSAGAE